MLTIQTFFAMFNNLKKDKDKQEYRMIFEDYNIDVYGYCNE
jgi:hypothetical protein